MGGRRFRVFAAVLGLGFVLALVIGAAGVGSSKALGASTTLTVLGGEVSVRHGSAQFTAAVDGELLNAGDGVRTGTTGRAVLTYFEGSSVTIEPSTELVIDTANATTDGGTVVAMTQIVGRTWHVVTKLVTSGSKYEVRTPASTASVRGTSFEVNSDAGSTTIATTEGTVVAQVSDPARGGATVEVPVTAGTVHAQQVGAPVAPTRSLPEPERRVTITVGATNSIVVDPAGRANGVTKDGKLVAQTPGATVTRDGDGVVITLPDVPDGKLATHVAKESGDDDEDVEVETRVEGGGPPVVVTGMTADAGDNKTAGVEIARDASGATLERVLGPNETQALPTPRANTELIQRTVAPVSASSARPATTPALPIVMPQPRGSAQPAPVLRYVPALPQVPPGTKKP